MEKFKIELTEREVQALLSNLLSQINIDVQILFDNTHDPAGECFVVMLEALNEAVNLYVDLNALLPKKKEGFGECPYKGTRDGKEICTLTYKQINGAVQCDFEFENCHLYKHCEHYRKLEAEGNEQ